MKNKLLFLAMLFAVSFSLSSCKKNYVCLCTWMDGNDQETSSDVYPDVTRGDANDACDTRQSALINAGNTEVSCNIQ